MTNRNRSIHLYEYVAAQRVIDGDTFDAFVKLTPSIAIETRVRIRGLWCPELDAKNHEDRVRAVHAREQLKKILDQGGIELTMHGTDSFGRWVCDVVTEECIDVAAHMIEIGLGDAKKSHHPRHEIEKVITETDWIPTRTYEEYRQ